MPASRSLVIDTDLARAAGGEEAVHPTSKNCRDFLKEMLKTSHEVVFTPEIQGEWNKHQSAFARTWRRSMVARSRLFIIDSPLDENLRRRLLAEIEGEGKKQAVLKDCHLVEAALKTDRKVISLDETVRTLLRQATRGVGEIRPIVWVNPDRAEETPILWLHRGAPDERDRQLGYIEE